MKFILKVLTFAVLVLIGHCSTKQIFDYVIDNKIFVVGGGSAGSTLASRLTEDNATSVLLLEAGRKAPFYSEIPLFCNYINNKHHLSWNYLTEPQSEGCEGYINHSCNYFAGKALGGGSATNGMMYIRGNAIDFDLWARKGATGWSYKEVLPYFIKSEGTNIKENIDKSYHGTSGPLTVSYQNYKSNLADYYLESAKELGCKIIDVNGASQNGFSPPQFTLRDGLRCSTEKAFLRPAYQRKNLQVLTDAYVTKILIDNATKEAVGVQYTRGNESSFVDAKREVILSAGVVRSPQILLLSGIGPKEHLADMKIQQIVELPVGLNYHDHIACNGIPFIVNDTFGVSTEDRFTTLSNYESNATDSGPLQGLLASPFTLEAVGFLKSDFEPEEAFYPDLQLLILNTILYYDSFNNEVRDYYLPLKNQHAFQALVANIHPRQRGSISLRSSNPFDDPIITFDYLANDTDANILAYGLKKSYEFGLTEVMNELGAKAYNMSMPGCESFEIYSEEYFKCHAKVVTSSLDHGAGSCKMGAIDDNTAVVDPFLRVRGVNRLRVVDTSIMPQLTSGNTNAPAIMIAEKAADIIKTFQKSI